MKTLFFMALTVVSTACATDTCKPKKRRFEKRRISQQDYALLRAVSYAPLLVSVGIATYQKNPMYRFATVGIGFGLSQLTNKALADHEKKNISCDMLATIPEARVNPLKAARIIRQQKRIQAIERNRKIDEVVLTAGAGVVGVTIGAKAWCEMQRGKKVLFPG